MKPKQHLEYYTKIYPNAWVLIDEFRGAREVLPPWPKQCFIPLAAVYNVILSEIEKQNIEFNEENRFPLLNDVGIIGALAAWRFTQRVYRFDPDVYRAVLNTPFTEELPHDVLFNLPEWCVYIETPGFKMGGEDLAGFFAFLDYDTDKKNTELRLVFDYNLPAPCLYSIPIALGPWPLTESVNRIMSKVVQETGAANVEQNKAIEQTRETLTSIISLLIYLCADNAEFGAKGKRPTWPSNNKIPPEQPKVWDVGLSIGTALRRAMETAGQPDGQAGWHGYWTEPLNGKQKYVIKWNSPLATNNSDDIPLH